MNILNILRPEVIQSKICQENEIVISLEKTKALKTNTGNIVYLQALIKTKNGTNITKLLVCKLSENNSNYYAYSKKEMDFYEFILQQSFDDLPIVKGYLCDVDSQKILLLDDISTEFHELDIEINNIHPWLLASKSLAKFHSSFWNLDDKKLNSLFENEIIDDIINEFSDSFIRFQKHIKDKVNNSILDIYNIAFNEVIDLEREELYRKNENKNISIKNGDSHINNFMFSNNVDILPKIIDFQFWGKGIAVGDLAHLSRVKFRFDNLENAHRLLVDTYYEELLNNGILNYSKVQCIYDYKSKVASMMFIPMWQYVGFNLDFDYWGAGINNLVDNYLACNKLTTAST